MRLWFVIPLLASAAALATSARLDAQQPSACAVPSRRAELRDRFERFVASEDSLETAFRQRYQLPHLPPDSVLVVTDEALCERAARAYYRDSLGPRPIAGVAVLRIGDTYVVYGANRGGHWIALNFYTRDFVYIAGILS